MILFIVLLQHQSRASPVPNESSLNSRDLFDPASEESIAKESLNPHSYLNSRSESDTNLFATSEQPNGLTLFDDPRLTASTDDSCPISGQSRKRDGGMICPAPGSLESPSSGIFGDHNEEELDQQAELDSDGRNPIICSEILFFFGRIFDVCCDGPYGPFVIDPDVRLIYSWISDCRSGMSN